MQSKLSGWLEVNYPPYVWIEALQESTLILAGEIASAQRFRTLQSGTTVPSDTESTDT